jgi:hypothetical protein
MEVAYKERLRSLDMQVKAGTEMMRQQGLQLSAARRRHAKLIVMIVILVGLVLWLVGKGGRITGGAAG